MTWTRGEYQISTEQTQLDLERIHHHLSTQAYWSLGIPREVVERAFRNSVSFGVYRAEEQVGWARVVSDRATFAYLADVFILPEHRGRGLSKWLMECVLAHPELQGLRRWMLATRDAHPLYAQFGFTPIPHPERFMQLHFPDVYKKSP
jgi:GNAT superfamily N-acetyltransferase